MTITKLKINFNYIIICILIAIIFLQRTCTSSVDLKDPIITTKIDTVLIEKTDTIKKEVPVYISIPSKPSINYIPSDNCDSLRKQYLTLRDKHITRNVYKDTIKLDSIGMITLIDTVQFNKLLKRVTINNYQIPIITKTNTIIKQTDPKRQLYIGGNLFGDKNQLQLFTPGLIYKDKKDRMYQVNAGFNFDGSITFGLGAYWKINLNKK